MARQKRDWLAARRRLQWWAWGRWVAPPGVLSPPRTTVQRIKFEREWDRRFKEGSRP